MIEDIECLRPELQLEALMQRELAAQGEILLPSTAAAHFVPTKSSRLPGGRSGERRRIDAPTARHCWIIDVERHTRIYVWPDVDQRAICRIELRSSNQVHRQR